MADKTFGDRLLPLLSTMLVMFLLLAAVAQYIGVGQEREAAIHSRYLMNQAVLAERVAGTVASVVAGDEGSAAELESLAAEIKTHSGAAPAALSSEYGAQLDAAATARKDAVAGLAALAGVQPALAGTRTAAGEVNQLMPQLLAQVGNLVGLMNREARAIAAPGIERFEVAGQRVQQDIGALAEGVGNLGQTTQRLVGSDDYMGQLIRGLSGADATLGMPALTGPEAEAQLAQVQDLYAQISGRVRTAVASGDQLARVAAVRATLNDASERWYEQIQAMADSAQDGALAWLLYAPLALMGAALLAFLGILGLYRGAADARRTAESQASQNDRNQKAILRLLDELGSLADGDLTVQATVTEDITGAIADSINYAVEALRDLVTTIERSAIHIDAAARQTQASAAHLAKASENQSQQVSSATESIANMAVSIEEVSGNAERSADVARHSVDIAHKGGDAVRRTIEGMNTIRETIQETSKRIKRLGESSQEIGNIVELINDIAEQTNILALNASIQASMAGEAGRGFAVVADEVQRLAEKSANATKQIEVLVRTIQSDTNEAVVSMERSTTDVVSGALLAENAGASLDEIEKVSNQIASLVQNISATARQQATAAAGMTRNMGVLQEISAQTAESTGATSAAIGKLAKLAGELRKSVSGFTLPDTDNRQNAGAQAPDRPGPKAALPPAPRPIVSAEAG